VLFRSPITLSSFKSIVFVGEKKASHTLAIPDSCKTLLNSISVRTRRSQMAIISMSFNRYLGESACIYILFLCVFTECDSTCNIYDL